MNNQEIVGSILALIMTTATYMSSAMMEMYPNEWTRVLASSFIFTMFYSFWYVIFFITRIFKD